MQRGELKLPVILYLWWILSNGVIAYFSIIFFLSTIQMNDRKYILIWLVINVFLTIIVTALQISGTFWLEILLLIVYVLIFLKIRLQDMLAPIAILFTIRTFMEGFTAVLTAYASKHWKLSFDSIVIQMLISLFFDIIFLLMIQWIQRKFLFSLQKSISSYLYVLLLPCALIVLAIR